MGAGQWAGSNSSPGQNSDSDHGLQETDLSPIMLSAGGMAMKAQPWSPGPAVSCLWGLKRASVSPSVRVQPSTWRLL